MSESRAHPCWLIPASCCLPCAAIISGQAPLCSVILTVLTEGTLLSLLDKLREPASVWERGESLPLSGPPERGCGCRVVGG